MESFRIFTYSGPLLVTKNLNYIYRVKLDRITSSSLVPAASGDTTQRAGDDVEMKDLTKQGVRDKEDIVVSWQQKIFSQVHLD